MKVIHKIKRQYSTLIFQSSSCTVSCTCADFDCNFEIFLKAALHCVILRFSCCCIQPPSLAFFLLVSPHPFEQHSCVLFLLVSFAFFCDISEGKERKMSDFVCINFIFPKLRQLQVQGRQKKVCAQKGKSLLQSDWPVGFSLSSCIQFAKPSISVVRRSFCGD